MLPCDFKLGNKFRNINTGDTFVVVKKNGVRYFENENNSDLYNWIDENLYVDLGLKHKNKTNKLFDENEMIDMCNNLDIETEDKYIEVKYVKELIKMFKHRDTIIWNDEKEKYQEKIDKKINWIIRNARTI